MSFRRPRSESDPFEPIPVYFPKATLELLRKISEERKLPISRLACIAVDNELDAPVPFNYNIELPSTEFIPYAYSDEAQRIAKYMYRFPSGVGRDQLVLCRRNMGVEDRGTFMYALRELIEAEVIEEIDVPLRAKFNYAKDYKYVRLKNAFSRRKKKEAFEKAKEELAAAEQPFKEYGVGDETEQE